MLLRRIFPLALLLTATTAAAVPARAQLITGGESLLEKLNPFKTFDPSQPVDVLDLCKQLDCVSEKLRNDGLIVVKQPDVFGQARLTRFRRDVESEMNKDLANFHLVLAARIGRLDAATTTQTTSLAAALSAPGTTHLAVPTAGTGAVSAAGAGTPAGSSTPAIPPTMTPSFGAGSTFDWSKTAFGNLTLDRNVAGGSAGTLSLGVDPTVYLDEKKRFLEHLNELRRLNLGPDQNDSSGYGLFLVRMPVSITPGEWTYQGHGAELAVTIEHEFPSNFLQTTYRDLVINDVVDKLGPVVFELIRSGNLEKLQSVFEKSEKKQPVAAGAVPGVAALPDATDDDDDDDEDEDDDIAAKIHELEQRVGRSTRSDIPKDASKESYYNYVMNNWPYEFRDNFELFNQLITSPDFRDNLTLNPPSTRTPKDHYPIAPREMLNFFLYKNVYRLAKDAKGALLTKTPRETDVRSYLRHSLNVAYDAMARITKRQTEPPAVAPLNNTDLMDKILEAVQERRFGHPWITDPSDPKKKIYYISELERLYYKLVYELGRTRDHLDGDDGTIHEPIASLCWAIAVDAALLDHAMSETIRRVFEGQGIACDVPSELHLYRQDEWLDDPTKAMFNDFVKYRWPVITFSLDPVTDQQNVADSFNLKRDLQLALSYAFATGQINFSQLNTFRRQIEQSSDTIALNRTVTGFAHGNDTFGFRFTPRFQNPPNQRTNLGVIASQLISGGPGPDYQTKKSKLEPGLREITAVVLLPTFLPTIRMQTSTNWFKLTDPEHLKFHTKRMLEQGRKVQELRQAVLHTCSTQQYREADLRVLQTKLAQLDKMLPAQSTVVKIPYDNTPNGFELLLSEGANALVPELVGYDGADYALQGKVNDIYIYGKYISVLDTKVIVGGAYVDTTANPNAVEILSREVVHVQIPATANPTVTDGDGKTYFEVYLATPNGISNRVLVPCLPAPEAPQVAFNLNSQTQGLNIFYQWFPGPDGKPTLIATDDPGTGSTKTINITWDSPTSMAPETLQATFTGMANGQPISFSLPANSGNKDDYTIDSRLITVCVLDRLKTIITSPTLLTASVPMTIQVAPWLPPAAMGYRVIGKPKTLKTQLTIKLVPNITNQNKLPGVAVPPTAARPAAAVNAQTFHASGNNPRLSGSSGDRDPSVLRTAQSPTPPENTGPPLTLPPNLSTLPNPLGALPPLPAAPTVPAIPSLPTAPAGAVSAVTNQVMQAANVPSPTILVNPSPVVLVAPPTSPPTKSHPLFRMFHKKKGAAAVPPPR
jgi:hypothetical protein